jgi:hypothetical protein
VAPGRAGRCRACRPSHYPPLRPGRHNLDRAAITPWPPTWPRTPRRTKGRPRERTGPRVDPWLAVEKGVVIELWGRGSRGPSAAPPSRDGSQSGDGA